MKKTKYLSYIEDTVKHHKKIAEVAKLATRKAFSDAKNNSIEITYLKGNSIVSESSLGEITIVDSEIEKRRLVKVGSRSKLS